MRKATAILFALIVFSGLTEFHQALKLPVLLSHYQYHKTTNRSLSLLEFLKLHYFTNQHPDDNDENQDNELPFKSPAAIQHTDVPVLYKKELIPGQPTFFIETEKTHFIDGKPCHIAFAIFHPPRQTGTSII